MSLIQQCLQPLIDKYNAEVFSNYDKLNANVFDSTLTVAFPQLGGSPPVDYTVEPIPDSFYNPDAKNTNEINTADMDSVLLGKKLFLIMGAGPIGLSLAANLCDAYPDYVILVIDVRIHNNIQHLRPPYKRERRLAGLGLIAINDVESALYTVLRQRTNVKFLFVNSPTITHDLVFSYVPRFVFNCTGSRSKEFVNDIADTLILNRDRNGLIMQIVREAATGNYFVHRGGKFRQLPGPTDANPFIYLYKEHINTFTQGDVSIDVWTRDELPDSVMGDVSFDDAHKLADKILLAGLVESPTNTDLIKVFDTFDKTLSVTVSKFEAGLRIHSRYPCQVHDFNGHIFVKFDLGDSLGAVPVRHGTNIAIGRKIIMGLLLPLIDEMIACLP